MKKLSFLLILFALMCFCSVPARADFITIAISGQVTAVEDPANTFEGKAKIGDAVTGTYTFDSTAPDSDPSPTAGNYQFTQSPSGIFLNLKGLTFQTNPSNMNFAIQTSHGQYNYDWYGVNSLNNLSLPNGGVVSFIGWELFDSKGTALSSDALPVTAPVLSEWDNTNTLYVYGYDRSTNIEIVVTSAEIVPEPATLLILAIGSFFVRKSVR